MVKLEEKLLNLVDKSDSVKEMKEDYILMLDAYNRMSLDMAAIKSENNKLQRELAQSYFKLMQAEKDIQVIQGILRNETEVR